MATPFTTITDGLDWQAATFVNEIVDAYSERRQAAGYSSMASIAAGTDIQAASFWNTMQNGIDASVTAGYWADPSTAPFTGDAAVPVYSLATFYAAAGMDTYGWRRATSWEPGAVDGTWQNDVTFYYGPMQAGDIIGPWIFEDLQKSLSTLEWTTRASTANPTSREWRFSLGDNEADCDDGLTSALTTGTFSWSASSWESASGAQVYEAFAGANVSTGYVWFGTRYRAAAGLSSISTAVAHSCDIYWLPGVDSYNFADIDGEGLAEGELYLYETLTSATTATRTSTVPAFSTMNDSPLDAASPYSCPTSTFQDGVVVNHSDVKWVLKWSFTTSN